MIKLIKESTGLSQSQISNYLLTTRSAIAQVAIQKRALGHKRNEKLIGLFNAMLQYEQSEEFQLSARCKKAEQEVMEKQLEHIKFQLGESQFQSMLLQKKLVNMKLAYEKVILNLKVQPALLPTLTDDPVHDMDKDWLQVVTNDATVIYPFNCMAKQLQLRLQLDLLEAEQKILKAFLKKNKVKNEKNPLKRVV